MYFDNDGFVGGSLGRGPVLVGSPAVRVAATRVGSCVENGRGALFCFWRVGVHHVAHRRGVRVRAGVAVRLSVAGWFLVAVRLSVAVGRVLRERVGRSVDALGSVLVVGDVREDVQHGDGRVQRDGGEGVGLVVPGVVRRVHAPVAAALQRVR